MNRYSRPAALVVLLASAGWAILTAAERSTPPAAGAPQNTYYLYTGAFVVPENGAVKIPDRYVWSVESSWRGLDAAGRDLADPRVMLRLHDPAARFSALTAQMDLATAARLHHELGEMIIKKLQDPAYQDRSHHVSPAGGNDLPGERN